MSKTAAFFYCVFFLALIAGIVTGFMGIEISSFKLFLNIYVLLMMIYCSYYLYIVLLTKNVNTVEKYINRKKKHPYYAVLLSLNSKDYDQAEMLLQKLGRTYSQPKIALRSTIQLETNQLKEAEETISKIKNPNIRHHNFALLALLKDDLEAFQKHKSQVKHKGLQYSLDAEEAFMNKEFEKAEKFGELAISSTAGLQKWVLVKSLEHQRNNLERKFFF
ncbi:hypothetical protein ACE198_22235 [Neobacillus sp. KR4-4]|uniref:hypothetical protein n=1 Tax=Neobacillus sp. KR4-4 TaxID=3344872 RepID=UPI0035C9755F